MIESLSDQALLESLHLLVRRSGAIEAEVLVHLGEVDERKLYLARAYPSLFAFCVEELGFSEDAAYNRIVVARAGRRLPALIEAVREGALHLAGARLLAPRLNPENAGALLAEARGKPKRQIEELLAARFPQPAVPAEIRKLPQRACPEPAGQPSFPTAPSPAAAPRLPAQALRPVQPLAEDAFKVQFTASRALRDKLEEARGLLRHRFPAGDLPAVIEAALDSLIAQTKKERFAVGRKARTEPSPTAGGRNIPAAIRRAVYARDGGRCTFSDDRGRRCNSLDGLEFDHVEGFARTRAHSVESLRLLCRAHNQLAAEQLYGRAFMARSRLEPLRLETPRLERSRVERSQRALLPGEAACPGTSSQRELL